MKTYAKLVAGQLITTCAPDDDTDLISQITADGFKLYDEDAGEPEVGKFQSLNPVYFEEAEKISLFWEVVDDPEKVQAEIARLEAEIAASDYKVVKSYEYTLAGIKIPYDAVALYTERQALRDQIGELETLLVSDDTLPEPDDEIPPGIIADKGLEKADELVVGEKVLMEDIAVDIR